MLVGITFLALDDVLSTMILIDDDETGLMITYS
jgi:hypothetical protein